MPGVSRHSDPRCAACIGADRGWRQGKVPIETSFVFILRTMESSRLESRQYVSRTRKSSQISLVSGSDLVIQIKVKGMIHLLDYALKDCRIYLLSKVFSRAFVA